MIQRTIVCKYCHAGWYDKPRCPWCGRLGEVRGVVQIIDLRERGPGGPTGGVAGPQGQRPPAR